MRPKDLKTPFLWTSPEFALKDQVLYVQKHEPQMNFFPGWIHPEIFSQNLPIRIEYCSGNGTWIAQKAKEFPQYNWVAVEKKFVRVRKIWSKLKNLELSNLFLVCGEALRSSRLFFPSSSVEEIFINFPDPWPKRHHAKYRLIQPNFINEMERILKPLGKMTLVTDDVDYSRQMIRDVLGQSGFKSLYEDPYFKNEREGYGTSYFEDLWRGKEKEIRYHLFQKKA